MTNAASFDGAIAAFDQATIEKIGEYVYALFDPDQRRIPFYVGKGTGNRVFSHAQGALRQSECDDEGLSPKLETIRAIRDRGRNVLHVIVQFGLSREEALLVESALIDMINYILPDSLTNAVSGHGSAQNFRDADELARSLCAEPVQCGHDCLLLIKIERRWTELLSTYGSASQIPPNEIYAATRRAWKINVKRAGRAPYVLAVAKGLVRGVYEVQKWADDATLPERKCFTGIDVSNQAAGVALINRSVASFFARGAQSPIRYICCDVSPNKNAS